MVQGLSRKQGHLHSFQQYSHNCVVSFGIIWCLLYINAINVKSLPHAKLFFDFFPLALENSLVQQILLSSKTS